MINKWALLKYSGTVRTHTCVANCLAVGPEFPWHSGRIVTVLLSLLYLRKMCFMFKIRKKNSAKSFSIKEMVS